jgi:ribosomal protein uS17
MADQNEQIEPEAETEGEEQVAEDVSPEAPEEPAAEAPVEEPEAEAEPAAEEEPAAEAEPAGEVEASAEEDAPVDEAEAPAEEPAAEASPEAPAKPKRKRVPRSERRQRSKPKRERQAERAPITRVPKPESERGNRQERRGVVVSGAMDKTIVVRVETLKSHPRYKKIIRRSTKFHAHDERNEAKVGDLVRIVETRPLSKTKRWRLAEILEVAK